MEMEINWLAIGGATLVAFFIGFLWYGPVFGKAWMAEVGMTQEDAEKGNMAKIFGVSLVLQFIMAYCLYMSFYAVPEVGAGINTGTGAAYGFLTGFGFAFTAIGVNAMFEQKSWKYIAINGGFWIVVFTLMGLILGTFR